MEIEENHNNNGLVETGYQQFQNEIHLPKKIEDIEKEDSEDYSEVFKIDLFRNDIFLLLLDFLRNSVMQAPNDQQLKTDFGDYDITVFPLISHLAKLQSSPPAVHSIKG